MCNAFPLIDLSLRIVLCLIDIKKFIFLVENLTFIYVITFIYSYYFERDCRKKEEITEKKTEAALFEILG